MATSVVLSSTRSKDAGTREEDYLNDKLQTVADLQNLESLLETMRGQQVLLKKQLDEVTESFKEAERWSKDHEQAVQQKAALFSKQQEDIDQRLIAITKSEKSDNAVQRFEVSMSKLRRLDIATGYLQLLQEVEMLSAQAREDLRSSPRRALPSYARLRSLVGALQEAQPAAEGAAPHLIDHVNDQTITLYSQMKDSFEESLRRILDEMAWPSKELNLSDDIMFRFTDQVELLLDLQEADLRAQISSMLDSPPVTQAPVLLPLQVMVHPIELRFRFHFCGDRPTNRQDKPEYFLSHVLDLLDEHGDFLLDFVQPIFDRRARSSGLEDTVYSDAISAFVTALIPMVCAKCLTLVPPISSQPQLLSHFVHELMSFDSALRDSWTYTPVPHLLAEWKGLTWFILTEHGYFNAWLNVEKDFALSRYMAIMESSDQGEFDHDSTGPGSTKPTKGAIRVNDLLETVTDRYRSLSSFSQKLRFLIDIQLEIFDRYHQRIHEALQAYLVRIHRLGLILQGSAGKSDTEDDSSGTKAVESLCKIFGSAEYIERKMSDWSDDVFFLELWEELQDRARRSTGPDASVGRNLNAAEVAAKTSSTIAKPIAGDFEPDNDGGALFDETASAYRKLRLRAEEEITSAAQNNVRRSLWAYYKVSGWASLSAGVSDISGLSTTAALDATLQVLSADVGLLSSVLSAAPLRRVIRQVCLMIQREIWDNVLMRHSFSGSGVMQLKKDVVTIQNIIDIGINYPGEAGRGMRKLNEGLTLLGLPIKASNRKTGDEGAKGAEGWEFEADGDDEDETIAPDEDKVWGLWEVERRLFRSNESARKVLTDMGVEVLTESESRSVLERRVEVGS